MNKKDIDLDYNKMRFMRKYYCVENYLIVYSYEGNDNPIYNALAYNIGRKCMDLRNSNVIFQIVN
jgi:hypothetical protein